MDTFGICATGHGAALGLAAPPDRHSLWLPESIALGVTMLNMTHAFTSSRTISTTMDRPPWVKDRRRLDMAPTW
jgi:hypothetical protein